MKKTWIRIVAIIGLTFCVSGTAQFVHLHFDHDHHPVIHEHQNNPTSKPTKDSHDSHHECSFCQDLALMRAMNLELPVLTQVFQATNETVYFKGSVSFFSASYIIPFPRPPPSLSL